MTLDPPPGKQAYDEFQGVFRRGFCPDSDSRGAEFGPGCRAGLRLTGGQGVVTESGRGSCPKIKVLMIETRTERGSGSSEKAPRENDPASDSVDDARRLYVKKTTLVRTKCEPKKAGKTTERRKAPRSSDRGSFRDVRVGRRERLYERKREKARGTTDRRGTRSKSPGCP